MRVRSVVRLSPLILLLSCTKGGVVPDSADSGGLVRDTEWVGADSTPESRADSDDTAGSDDTDDTGVVSPYAALSVQPAAPVVSPGAVWAFRAVVTEAEGARVDAVVEWQSSDEGVFTVDAQGQAQAVAPGEAVLSARFSGLEAWSQVVVRADGLLQVTVLDGVSGLPLTDARVAWGTQKVAVDSAGVATLPVPEGEEVDITVFAPDQDYIAATVYSLALREVVIPLRPGAEEEAPPAAIHGGVDLAQVPGAAWDEVVVGLAGGSVQRSPLLMGGDDLLAEDRLVTWLGAEFSMPGNTFIAGVVEDWAAVAWEGPVALWGIAGAVPIAELSASLDSSAQAFALLLDHLDGFRYALLPDLSANPSIPLGATLTPTLTLDEQVLVELPELPGGFEEEDAVLTLVLEQHDDEGYTLAGFGQGRGLVTAPRVPASAWTDSVGAWVLAWAEVGGAGAGAARTLTLTPVEGGACAPEDFLELPSVDAVMGSDRSFQVTTDPQVSLVRAYVSTADGGRRDLIFPAGVFGGTVHSNGPALPLGRTFWSVSAVQTWDQTYEGLLGAGGGLAPRSLEDQARRVAALDEWVTGS